MAKNSNRPRMLLKACLLLLIVGVVPGMLTWRAWRQVRLDRALIAHIAAYDADAVLADLRAGAEPNTFDSSASVLTFRQFLRKIVFRNKVSLQKGDTALTLAVCARDPIIGFYIESGDSEHVALRKQMALALLEAGADPNVGEDSSSMPVMCGINLPGSEVATSLLAHRANANAHDKEGCSALEVAINTGDDEKIKLLLEHSANPNLPLLDGDTPLINAVVHARLDRIKLLLAHHADPDIQDASGQTAISLATINHAVEISRLLRQAGAKR